MTDSPSSLIQLFITCPRGIETMLLEELRSLGAVECKETIGGVHAKSDVAGAYRLCLWSRLASRVLMPLSKFPLDGVDSLYAAAHDIHWPDLFDVSKSFLIEVAGRSNTVTHTHYAALKVKDAIADRFRAVTGKRPDVDSENPDIRIHLHLDGRTSGDQAQLSLDLSGSALHRRGWRARQVEAPLKENLAAALLIRSGWPAIAQRGGALLDLFTGSGTFVVEAGWIAGDHAPGLMREDWGFTHWNAHQPQAWASLREEALARAEAGFRNIPPLAGIDNDPRAISIARDNGKRAGLTGKVDFTVNEATLAKSIGDVPGLLIANPPYGERLSDEAELIKLHSLLGGQVRANFPGWKFALFTGKQELGFRLGIKADKVYSFFNGAIPCKLLVMEVFAQRGEIAPRPDVMDEHGEMVADTSPVPAAPAEPRRSPAPDFENRLKKNLAHLGKWARRSEVSNYRLYDNDLPEYAVAVDIYATPELHVVVQEYAPPKTIEPAVAERRLRQALQVIQHVLELPMDNLHYKLRKAQKGTAQYQKQGAHERYHVVTEHGCKLWANFDDYLDTGLFLDHRPMRQRIQKEARNKRVLNLFCYTGTASIHAAVGGADHTLSVDMSNTYLDWLGQNFELNNIPFTELDGRAPLPSRLPPHATLRADCVEWLARTAQDDRAPKFDLIFCDPPTFSNSKKMEDSWDIQRDHVSLIGDAVQLLAPGGVLYFSTNRQRFKLDALEGLKVEDITLQTLGEDYKRPPAPHRAWRITRG
ncbi:MAG: bifunctional 23S rRNA (guanine(2069)-N(7))-methyltransferase RlmK/23S rRNA (guanine(2445)-N(2))-methyltransferase RlmL [Pseudomonadota bacterium]